MKIRDIYELAVQKGIENDPRSREAVLKLLEKEQKNFNELKEDEKKEYDQDRLFNPYGDTRVLFGEPEHEVNRVLTGIDMEAAEVLLADRLTARGQPVDLIIAHHPEGKAMSALYQVMKIQEDVLAGFGVPINVAEGIMASRISEVKRGLLPLNHNRAVDAARLLGIPLMCVHTAADNLVQYYLQNIINEEKPETLEELIKFMKSIPEYAEAVKYNAGPVIVVGGKEKRAGRIMVDMTGGTSGSEDAYAKLAVAGVGTLVVMHIGEKHRKEAEKNHINVIIAGHMASDSLGMNLFLDELAQRSIEVIPCSGLLRYVRRSNS
ncbi:Nif3-like dinuclear metal center hexameric protein [Pelotomaculum terephthalicicum JT]|uniref:Nif3-like dinuclear metal center hexameric protein n=1 Tax=Pelotomaculum terephthalicicum TaxID=206393 RepID=UPI001F039FB9|nr:Nif3-like dinuclear metal center hexameric protein [Pelotomaculum terephthalicicum]MCG9968146.1 Nif3-like dinuclear metal center hexameric protein [Pelotomaculum terephthalicicum JT]